MGGGGDGPGTEGGRKERKGKDNARRAALRSFAAGSLEEDETTEGDRVAWSAQSRWERWREMKVNSEISRVSWRERRDS
jgi:hypothetical protein